MALSRYFFEYVRKDYQDLNTGEPLLMAFKQNIITPSVEMLTVKGLPFLQMLNTRLLQIIECGLIDFWSRNIMHKRVLTKVCAMCIYRIYYYLVLLFLTLNSFLFCCNRIVMKTGR